MQLLYHISEFSPWMEYSLTPTGTFISVLNDLEKLHIEIDTEI